MADPINFNKARKAKARADKAQKASENRAKFGRTKAEKQAEATAAERLRRAIEAAKRER